MRRIDHLFDVLFDVIDWTDFAQAQHHISGWSVGAGGRQSYLRPRLPATVVGSNYAWTKAQY